MPRRSGSLSKENLRQVIRELKESNLGYIGLDEIDSLCAVRLKQRMNTVFEPSLRTLQILMREQKISPVKNSRNFVMGYVFSK